MIVRQSPAKVNLFLKVLGKRSDGYHDILSLMQRISLCDEMRFDLKGNRVKVICPGGLIPENKNNIAYRAAEAILSNASCHSGVEITINKKIPVAAGLGGGSSNAATTLVTLNEMTGTKYSTEELMQMGARLGADVPFFVFGKTSLASGIGDRLKLVEGVPKLWFILVNPGFEVSTGDIYENLKLGLTKEPIKYRIPRFVTMFHVAKGLYNDLEKVSLRFYPVLSDIKELLTANGALGSLMSGSGPTVFGIFRSEADAKRAERNLKEARVGSVFRACSI
ncbi:MAG: 4-(cytidine 5'-diphospho)-2-C-methyl-D-erythritol kinase [Thermodesulfobacteriota bacterium]|nr:4-(cytidine 5'-diphospho)-2-C-methyl-D-erythritol kinase [Thermodesulfobacteriota bacterium]